MNKQYEESTEYRDPGASGEYAGDSCGFAGKNGELKKQGTALTLSKIIRLLLGVKPTTATKEVIVTKIETRTPATFGEMVAKKAPPKTKAV